MRLLIVGAGYSARVVARHLSGRHTAAVESIHGTTRNQDTRKRLVDNDIHPIVLPAENPGQAWQSSAFSSAWRNSTHLLVSVGPDRDAQRDRLLVQALAELRTAAGRDHPLLWTGYLSSISVYGNHDGHWVDESSRCQPEATRARDRLRAEEYWQEFAAQQQCPLAIFRLAGIYGPGRNILKKLVEGTARNIVRPDQYFNRVHVEDIATAVASSALNELGGVFNLADGQPASPQQVLQFASELTGIEMPPPIAADDPTLSPMTRSFYQDNKRIDNRRSLSIPNMHYQYPDYQSGLSELWSSGHWSRM